MNNLFKSSRKTLISTGLSITPFFVIPAKPVLSIVEGTVEGEAEESIKNALLPAEKNLYYLQKIIFTLAQLLLY